MVQAATVDPVRVNLSMLGARLVGPALVSNANLSSGFASVGDLPQLIKSIGFRNTK